jgi:hypothetical protein
MQESLRVILLNTKQQLFKVVAVSSGDKQRIGSAPLDMDITLCHTYNLHIYLIREKFSKTYCVINAEQLGPRPASYSGSANIIVGYSIYGSKAIFTVFLDQ